MPSEIVDRAELGQRLYVLRKARRWSLDTVQARIGIAPSTLSRWERGVGRHYPELEHLAELAALYDVTVAELLAVDWPTRARFNPQTQRPAA